MEDASMEEAIAYVQKIKKNLSHRHKEYEELLQVLHDFGSNKISSTSVVSKVQSLLVEEPDLMRGFNAFIPNHSDKPNIQEAEMGVPKKQIRVPKKITKKDVLRGVEFVNRVQRRLEKTPTTMRKFYQVMIKYGNTQDLEFMRGKLSVILKKYPELVFEFSRFCCSGSNGEKEKEHGMKKNVMDDHEDAMFEVDMLVSWMKSAKEATEILVEACEKNPSERIDVATYLTSMNLRSIEQLYGDGLGVIILEKLHQSPGKVSPIILPRLSQKLEEVIERKIQIRSKVKQFHIGR